MTTPITFRHSNESDRPVLRRLAEFAAATGITGLTLVDGVITDAEVLPECEQVVPLLLVELSRQAVEQGVDLVCVRAVGEAIKFHGSGPSVCVRRRK